MDEIIYERRDIKDGDFVSCSFTALLFSFLPLPSFVPPPFSPMLEFYCILSHFPLI